MAENGIGGKALDAYLRQIVYVDDELALGPLPDDAVARAERVAASVTPGASNVMYLPWLVGSFAPGLDDHVRGGFVNMTLTSSRAELTRLMAGGAELEEIEHELEELRR